MSGRGSSIIAAPKGLARILTTIDLFLMALFVMSVGFKGLMVYGWAASSFPNGDLFLSILITAATAILFALLYAVLTSIVPRSGGDYVYVSRFLHPAIGFASSVNMVFVNIIWFALSSVAASSIIFLTIFSIGTITGSPGLTEVGRMLLTSPYAAAALAAALLVVYWGLTNVSLKMWAYIQRAAGIIAFVGLVAGIAAFASLSKEAFKSAVDAAFGVGAYGGLLQAARTAGYVPGAVNHVHTLGIAAALGLVLFYGFYPTYVAGEAKNTDVKELAYAMIGSTALSAVFLAIFSGLALNVVGKEFLVAVSYAQFEPAAGSYALLGYYGALAKHLVGSPLVLALIGISVLVWAFMLPVNFSLAATRCVFAWSLDGLAPLKLSYVTERHRTPFFANLAITGIAAIVLAVIVVNRALMAAFFGSVAATMLSMLIVSSTVIYNIFKEKGVSLYTVNILLVVGVASLILLLILFPFYLMVPGLGFIHPLILPLFVTVWIIGFLWYYIAVRYRRSKGEDIERLLKIIPPG